MAVFLPVSLATVRTFLLKIQGLSLSYSILPQRTISAHVRRRYAAMMPVSLPLSSIALTATICSSALEASRSCWEFRLEASALLEDGRVRWARQVQSTSDLTEHPITPAFAIVIIISH
jgi:hypothetical protein